MFCMNCGKELPDDARFCLQCGRPQTADAGPGANAAPVVRLACPACGSALPVPSADAEFTTCSYCRAALQIRRTMGKILLEELRWEMGEILFVIDHEAKWFGDWRLRFWTRAIGPTGEYNAADVRYKCQWPSPNASDNSAKAAHQALVTRLCTEGWEPIPSDKRVGRWGFEWWNDKFRRRVHAPSVTQ